jgi:hypothetical protein
MLRLRLPHLLVLGLALLPSCGTNEPTPPPRWFFTCGDPVCSGPRPHPGVPACSGQVPGQACPTVDATCDPMDSCNRLIVCASSDPTERPGGCPISRARFKRDIAYLSEADLVRLHDELRRIPLVTFRYRAAGPHDRSRLGFVIEDVEPSLAVDAPQDSVDLYGYASMAVAALQVQAKQIESLKRELAALRQELARSPRRPGSR